MNKLRGQVMKVLVQGLREATEEELYAKSPHRAKLTRKMIKSIRPRALGNQAAGVGYDLSRAPYADIRLAMSGPYKGKGGEKKMNPAKHIEEHRGAEIRKLGADTLKRISD